MQVARDEAVVDDRDQLDHVLALRDDLPPARTLGVPRVDRDHPLARRVQVGHEVEEGPFVPDEAVARVEVVEQPHDVTRHARPSRVPQVEIVDPVPPIGAEPDGEDRVAAVVRDFGGDAPVGMLGPLVHQHVLRLIGAQAVVVQLLKPVLGKERVLARGLGVAAVEEPDAVVRPGRVGELHPLQVIRPVAPAVHVAHPELHPVGPARRGAVGELAAVLRQRERRERHRPVL